MRTVVGYLCIGNQTREQNTRLVVARLSGVGSQYAFGRFGSNLPAGSLPLKEERTERSMPLWTA